MSPNKDDLNQLILKGKITKIKEHSPVNRVIKIVLERKMLNSMSQCNEVAIRIIKRNLFRKNQ